MNSKAFILTHLGLGDIIMCNGMINYIASKYESVLLVVKDVFFASIKEIYKYNPNISFYVVSHDREISVKFGFPVHMFNKITTGYDVYLAGMHKDTYSSFNSFPLCFYDDLKIQRSCFWTHSKIEITADAVLLFNTIKDYTYVFMANKCSSGILFNATIVLDRLNINKDEILIINLHENIYNPEHKYYNIAQLFLINRPLTHYTSIIENAFANILSDSSIFCLCHLLNIKTEHNYVITRGIDYSHLYKGESYEKDDVPIRVKFKRLIM